MYRVKIIIKRRIIPTINHGSRHDGVFHHIVDKRLHITEGRIDEGYSGEEPPYFSEGFKNAPQVGVSKLKKKCVHVRQPRKLDRF